MGGLLNIPWEPTSIKGIYWATGLFLRTPFTEGCAGANKKASPLGRQQGRLNNVAFLVTLRSVQFSSVQFNTTIYLSKTHLTLREKVHTSYASVLYLCVRCQQYKLYVCVFFWFVVVWFV